MDAGFREGGARQGGCGGADAGWGPRSVYLLFRLSVVPAALRSGRASPDQCALSRRDATVFAKTLTRCPERAPPSARAGRLWGAGLSHPISVKGPDMWHRRPKWGRLGPRPGWIAEASGAKPSGRLARSPFALRARKRPGDHGACSRRPDRRIPGRRSGAFYHPANVKTMFPFARNALTCQSAKPIWHMLLPCYNAPASGDRHVCIFRGPLPPEIQVN